MSRITTALGLLGLATAAACSDAPVHPVPSDRAANLTTAAVPAGAPVHSGPEMDYQSSLLRVRPAGTLMMAIERLNPATNAGDLYLATSADDGVSWSTPRPIVGTTRNERHPALVQLPSGSFALFYLVDEGRGTYRIHRATSPDGGVWTQHGAINLGWKRGGEINPAVIVEAGGRLTMTYHRLSGASYIAQSADGGATWDTRMTPITTSAASLPRIARRESDGVYLVTYQVNPGNGNLQLYAETSTDPYDWTAPAVGVSTTANDHDSQPIVLEDGSFFVPYAKSTGARFNLYYQRSADGRSWGAPVQLTDDADLDDVQPHPILHGTPGHLVLAWTRQKAAGSSDHDIWVNPDLIVQ